MAECQRCKKCFRWQWELVRHMKRQRPCKVVENVVERAKSDPNDTQGDPNDAQADPNDARCDPNDTQSDPNDAQGDPNDTQADPNDARRNPNDTQSDPNDTQGIPREKNQCEYCLKIFSTASNYNKHVKRCKLKDCEIRKKEIKVNKLDTEEKIEFVPPPPNTCRFCKLTFSRTGCLTKHLKTCKEKEIYKEQLDVKYEKLIQNIETQNNTHNDNSTNITNNVTINALGKETLEHINMQKVIEMISKHKAEGQTDHKTVFVIAGNMVSDYQKMIREVPENRNLMVGHERRQTAKIKRDEKFEVEEMNEALQEAFKNTSGHFYDKMSEIEENQTRPFKRDTKEIHKKVNDLKNHGFAVGRWKDEDKVRRRFKVANMDVGSEL